MRAATGPVDELIARSGNLPRLIRITAWINRFIGNIRARMKLRRDGEQATNEKPMRQPRVGRKQDADELRSARLTLLRVAQLADLPTNFIACAAAKKFSASPDCLPCRRLSTPAGFFELAVACRTPCWSTTPATR